MKQKNIFVSISKLINIAFMTFSIFVCFVAYYNNLIPVRFYWKGKLLITMVFLFLYLVFSGIYEAFDIKLSRMTEIIYSQVLSILFSDTIMYVIIVFILKKFPNILPALLAFAGQIGFIIAWAYFTKILYNKKVPPLKSVVIFEDETELTELIDRYELGIRFDVREDLLIDDVASDLEKLKGYEAVFLCDSNSPARNKILVYCLQNDIEVFANPTLSDMIMYGAKSRHMLYLPIMGAERYEPEPYYIILKRLFDFVFSLLLLIVLSPAMLITALAVKLSDGGPAFYKQVRMTKDGKLYNIIKFRSMRIDAEKDGARLSSGDNDDRITPVGRIIRKVRLDELPQLINILKGDMSFVGPRPERPEIADEYYKDLPEFDLRLQAKAGLTGYAQVYGKYNTTPYDKLKMDLMYISRPSIANDLAIIFATIKILFVPESTEGVSETNGNNNTQEN